MKLLWEQRGYDNSSFLVSVFTLVKSGLCKPTHVLRFTLKPCFLLETVIFLFNQIDGSTLRTICMQHGPLLTFHLGLTQGSALIRYSSRQEAAKAQGALHM